MSYPFGSPSYGDKNYGGTQNLYGMSAIPIIVEWYSNTLTYKGVFQSGSGNFLGCEFSLDESGCKDFVLFFAQSVGILKKDIIKIKLFNSDDYFFTGVVRETPIDGSTESSYNYVGFGLNDYLVRTNAESLSYANDTIQEILDDLLDTIITSKTPIIKNATKINPPNITIISLEINYNQVDSVLDTLKKIASSDGNEYIVGVDQEGEFFFRPRDTETKVNLVVGKKGIYGIDKYEPNDEYESRTKYFVLDKDGTYITTVSSSEDNDIYEDKITAPDIDNTSIENWAEGLLRINEVNTRRASIQWKIEEVNPLLLIADGRIRILSNIPPITPTTPNSNPYGSGTYGSGIYGGGQYTGKDLDDLLDVKEVKYILNGGSSVRNIQLGSLPVRLDGEILNVKRDLINLRVSLGR